MRFSRCQRVVLRAVVAALALGATVASTAVAARLLGGSRSQIVDALSQAWVDGQSLRTYRHAPNAGPRKSWAAGDATSTAAAGGGSCRALLFAGLDGR